MQIELVRPRLDSDWTRLEAEWRALESRADGSFFQSWTWIGCRVRERFTNPFLFRATDDGQVIGLALFNAAAPAAARLGRPTLWLHETGRARDDDVFIEHNAPLLARGRGEILQPLLAAALRHGRLRLSGVSEEVRQAAAAIGRCTVLATRPAPFASLEGATEASWLAGLGRSTRTQLRRSIKRYETAGRLVMHRASDLTEALAFLSDLKTLHQMRWVARGARGAFADPAFMTFHAALVARGLPRGEIDLLRVSAAGPQGPTPIGFLYNFRWRDRIYAYQGGFDYAAAGPHASPGLTCHHAAIVAAIEDGAGFYDFLAGEARYKTSLGSAEVPMHWLRLTSGRFDAGTVLRQRCATIFKRLIPG
jgi:CelD/BcsL family acetyltransferase involved in cellulose biosynthesis